MFATLSPLRGWKLVHRCLAKIVKVATSLLKFPQEILHDVVGEDPQKRTPCRVIQNGVGIVEKRPTCGWRLTYKEDPDFAGYVRVPSLLTASSRVHAEYLPHSGSGALLSRRSMTCSRTMGPGDCEGPD